MLEKIFGCSSHHYGEWRETGEIKCDKELCRFIIDDNLDIESSLIVDLHSMPDATVSREMEHFVFKQKYRRKCCHDGCGKTETKWKEIEKVPANKFCVNQINYTDEKLKTFLESVNDSSPQFF